MRRTDGDTWGRPSEHQSCLMWRMPVRTESSKISSLICRPRLPKECLGRVRSGRCFAKQKWLSVANSSEKWTSPKAGGRPVVSRQRALPTESLPWSHGLLPSVHFKGRFFPGPVQPLMTIFCFDDVLKRHSKQKRWKCQIQLKRTLGWNLND